MGGAVGGGLLVALLCLCLFVKCVGPCKFHRHEVVHITFPLASSEPLQYPPLTLSPYPSYPHGAAATGVSRKMAVGEKEDIKIMKNQVYGVMATGQQKADIATNEGSTYEAIV